MYKRQTPGHGAALAAALGDDLDAGTDRDSARSWGGADTDKNDPALPAGTQPLAAFVQAPPAVSYTHLDVYKRQSPPRP